MKILLTGKNGQLGYALAQALPLIATVKATDRNELNLENTAALAATVREFQPDIIINAAAYTQVDQAESDIETARMINATAPEILATEAKKIGASIIHYSTDYIFDGTTDHPYTEKDSPRPLNVYGQTKLEGENAIQAAQIPHWIFRTSWVYSAYGRNFLLTCLKLAKTRETLNIVNDQMGAPTHVTLLALTTLILLARQKEQRQYIQDHTGIYHLTCAGQASWYDFAKAIIKHYHGAEPLRCHTINPIETSQYPLPAQRPANSLLNCAHFQKTFGITPPHWETMLQQCMKMFTTF